MSSETEERSTAPTSTLRRATEILKSGGCTEVFLFGSMATEEGDPRSDFDLAVRGCPPRKFFHLLGRLLRELDRPVDLVDLDSQDPFARYLKQHGALVRVG